MQHIYDKDWFCFVCGMFTPKNIPNHGRYRYELASTEKLLTAYSLYFQREVVLNVPWAPSISCSKCYSALISWYDKKYMAKLFSVPVVWKEQDPHDPENCYYCKSKIKGVNWKKRGTNNEICKVPDNIEEAQKKNPYYHFCASATRPVAFGEGECPPAFPERPDLVPDSDSGSESEQRVTKRKKEEDPDYPDPENEKKNRRSKEPVLFTEAGIQQLIADCFPGGITKDVRFSIENLLFL